MLCSLRGVSFEQGLCAALHMLVLLLTPWMERCVLWPLVALHWQPLPAAHVEEAASEPQAMVSARGLIRGAVCRRQLAVCCAWYLTSLPFC